MCLWRFYIISNFLLLKENRILMFPILGREKSNFHLIYFLHIILVSLTLPFLPTFSNDYTSALLMFVSHSSPKPSGQFLYISTEPDFATDLLFEISDLFSFPDSALFSFSWLTNIYFSIFFFFSPFLQSPNDQYFPRLTS